jgi:hypothetical protein
MKYIYLLFFSISLLTLSACGGASGSGDPAPEAEKCALAYSEIGNCKI